jgi:hypothetical protein
MSTEPFKISTILIIIVFHLRKDVVNGDGGEEGGGEGLKGIILIREWLFD